MKKTKVAKLQFNTDSGKPTLALDREQFTDWLRRGFVAFYIGPRTAAPTHFLGASKLIGRGESLADDLESIYRELVPPDSQLLFRQSIGDLLRLTCNQTEASWPLQATSDLISLIARLRAVEAIQALVPAIGTSSLGEYAPNLVFETLSALKYLAPAEGVFDTVHELTCSPNFDDGYLLDTLLVLAECDPARFSNVFFSLMPRVNRLRLKSLALGKEEVEAFDNAVQEFSESIRLFIPNNKLSLLIKSEGWGADSEWLLHRIWDSNQGLPDDVTTAMIAGDIWHDPHPASHLSAPKMSPSYAACVEKALFAKNARTLDQYNQHILKSVGSESLTHRLKPETISGIYAKFLRILPSTYHARPNQVQRP